MKKIILLLIFSTLSCKPQNKENKEIEKIKHYKMENKNQYSNLVNKNIEYFDLIKFNKNKDEANNFNYQLKDGTDVVEFGETADNHFSESKIKQSLFIIRKEFSNKGIIKTKGVNFTSDCRIGNWYEFDESGKLIKEIDYDKPYKILVEDIIEFLKKNEAKFEAYIGVKKYINEKTKSGTWTLFYDGLFKNKYGRYQIKIDDQSQEIQEVIRVTGRDGERETIFKK